MHTALQVNQVWSGLGYYRRAKYLLDGARHIRDKLHGQFPTTAKGLLQIPGGQPNVPCTVVLSCH